MTDYIDLPDYRVEGKVTSWGFYTPIRIAMFSDIVSHREMLEELEREIVLRRRVYPRWIADGKIWLSGLSCGE